MSSEVLYQIRSALDHLVFDLIKLNPGKVILPKHWERQCEFPLLIDVPTKGNPPVPHDLPLPRSLFERQLPGITPQVFTFIESLQPYNAAPLVILGSLNTFRALAILSSIDKHRHLNLTVTRVRMDELISFTSGTEHGSWSILDHQAELERERELAAIRSQRPVCPNCHAVIHHRRNPAYSIEKVQSFLRR